MGYPPSIFSQVIRALDRHRVATGAKASVLRLGRIEQKALDEYLVSNMLDKGYGRPTGAKPLFDGVPVESVDAEHCLSTGMPAGESESIRGGSTPDL